MKYSKEDNRVFYQKIWKLAMPIALQNLMFSVVNASDALMLGFLDQTSLSAVSLAGQISFVYGLFNMTWMIGATMLVAQYWGKGDIRSVEKVTAFVMVYSVGTSMLFALAAWLTPQFLMRMFTPDLALIEAGASYLRVVAMSYLLSGISQIYLAIMKSCDKPFQSTLISTCSMIINIILNYFLIFGVLDLEGMGIVGAALATVIARGFEVLCVFVVIARRNCVAIRFRYALHPEKRLQKDFWKYSFPVLGNQMAWGIGYTMYSVIMGHLGTDATAANAIANIARCLLASFCWGLGSGAGILVGHLLGQNELVKAKEYGGRLCHISLVMGALSGLLLIAVSPLIVSFARISDVAMGYLGGMLLINAYYIIGNSINSTVITGIFSAGGDTRFGLICDAITMWIVIVPIGFVLAFWVKAPVLVVAAWLSLDEFVKLPYVYKYYKKYNWIKNLTHEKAKEECISNATCKMEKENV